MFLTIAHTSVQIIDPSSVQNICIFDPTRKDKGLRCYRCIKRIDPLVIWIQYDATNQPIGLGMVFHFPLGKPFSRVDQKCFYIVILRVLTQTPQSGGYGIGDGAVRTEENSAADL